VIAVLAVLATETLHPYNGMSNPNAAAGQNYADPSASDPTDSTDTEDPSLATDPASDASQSPTPSTTEPPAAPNPPAAPAAAAPAPVAPAPQNPPPPQPVPVPVPQPTTATPAPTTPSPSPAPPPGPVSFEAESSANSFIGPQITSGTCTPCSGGKKVRFVGNGNTLQFNNVSWGNATSMKALLVLSYINGDATSRTATVSVDGGTPVKFTFKSTSNWNNVGTLVLSLTLKSGKHRIAITNSGSWGPDFDRITFRAP
jgi:hypothetical protein